MAIDDCASPLLKYCIDTLLINIHQPADNEVENPSKTSRGFLIDEVLFSFLAATWECTVISDIHMSIYTS